MTFDRVEDNEISKNKKKKQKQTKKKREKRKVEESLFARITSFVQLKSGKKKEKKKSCSAFACATQKSC